MRRRISNIAGLLLFLCTFASFAAPNISLSDQQRIVTLNAESTQPLTTKQLDTFKEILHESDLSDLHPIPQNVLNAIGQLVRRAGNDHEFQQRCIDDFQGLSARVGFDIDTDGYVYLSDQINLQHGEKQTYGSIPRMTTTGAQIPDAVVAVDTERDRIGLEPLKKRYEKIKSGVAPVIPPDKDYPLANRRPKYPTEPALLKKLLALEVRDQEVRLLPKKPLSKVESEAFDLQMRRVDAENLPQVRAIINHYGFPNVREVGIAGVQATFLLVQHAFTDPALMQKSLHLARPLMESGDMPHVYYALLEDRVFCFVDHKPQNYGTQGTRKKTSFWYCPIRDPASVNARRAEMRMVPMPLSRIYDGDKRS
jgi:hypothetical protein